MLTKTIKIDDKEVLFAASAAIPRIYRIQFRRDIFQDMAKIEKSVKKSQDKQTETKVSESDIPIEDLEMFENVAFVMARRLKQDFPEVIETTQIYGNFASDFSYNEKRISNPDEVFIDENFFSFFPRKVICGRKDNILQSLSDIAITRSFAVKLFGTPEKALDKIISSAYEKKYQDCFRVGRYT